MKRLSFFTALLLFISSSSYAATVVFDPNSTTSNRIVNRIDGLVINVPGFSGIYDVIFTVENFDTVQATGGAPIYDLYNGTTTGQAVASDVTSVIVTVLNTTDANKVGIFSGLFTGDFYLPYTDSLVAGSVSATRGRYTTSWSSLAGPYGIDRDAAINGFVTASLVSSVPIPAAVWLFVSGLIGLIGVARRKNA